MIIRSKSCRPYDIELFDRKGVPLDLFITKITINMAHDELIKADISLLVTELDLMDCVLDGFIDPEMDYDLSQKVMNDWYIRQHFNYFLKG